jgi:hypothetical protein
MAKPSDDLFLPQACNLVGREPDYELEFATAIPSGVVRFAKIEKLGPF